MFRPRKLGKSVFLWLLAASVAVSAPAWEKSARAASGPQGSKAAPGRSDIVAVAGKRIVITRPELELAMARYRAATGKDRLTEAEINGLLEDLIRRRLLLQIATVQAYKKDPAVVAKVKNYEDSLIVARWVEGKIRSKVQVSEQEIRAYYDTNRQLYRTPPRVKASYILLRTRGEAEMILKKLHGGADFAQLAKQYSIDLPTGQRGGRIGTISESRPPSALGKVLFLLAQGETSEIITTKAGYAIFKADKIYPPGFKPYEAVHNNIRDQLFRKKARDSFKQIVQKLEKNAGIKIFKGPLGEIEQTSGNAPAPAGKQKVAAAPVVAGK
ncbi:MAG: peptidyl-prolyl cis-trans isomerase [Deltaproteobacteria bacterium]|jgi:parvulin-like peptidyl-prolyl isomerase|nr:peptidyl-prolyl cis-trans isomerase [Deltaproteobacteria bacterium]